MPREPINVDVDGIDGCKAGQEPVNCIAYLPVAIPTPPESGNNREVWTVVFVPFYITAPAANVHHGKLVPNYVVFSKGRPSALGWYQGYTGPITIRLTT